MARRALACLAPLLASQLVGAAQVVSAGALAARAGGGAAARLAERRLAAEAEAEERRFWSAEWAGLEQDLERLRSVTEPGAAKEHHHKSPLAGLKLNLDPKSTADLVPALAMLKGLYEDGKERIGKLNAREKKLKDQFEVKQKEHARRLEAIEAKFKNHSLSAEFRTNETHDENRIFSYWERCRERQHRQYHTSLKIQHGTLEKVKTMIDMYEKTISGKADKQVVAKQLRRVGGGALPDIVFLQDVQTATVTFCNDALKTLRQARRDGEEQWRQHGDVM